MNTLAGVREANSLSASQAYCRRVAAHYENFSVASWLLPRRLRQHFFNVYAYCRIADDLADESSSTAAALNALDAWEAELDQCFAGRPQHPAMIALADTVAAFHIPPQPFRDLIRAFRLDQQVTRYDTHASVLEYCRGSANPVGRIVLYLAECHERVDVQASDSICTGLQLANFCQDVARDFAKNRIYLPADSMREHGYDENRLKLRVEDDSFIAWVGAETARAESYLINGLPLINQVPRFLQIDLRLFIEGGLAICNAIRRRNYRVLSQRPIVSRWQKGNILGRALVQSMFTRTP